MPTPAANPFPSDLGHSHPLLKGLSQESVAAIMDAPITDPIDIPKKTLLSAWEAQVGSKLGLCIVQKGILAVTSHKEEWTAEDAVLLSGSSSEEKLDSEEHTSLSQPIAPLWKGDIYGELGFLGADETPAEVVAATNVQLKQLNSAAVRNILRYEGDDVGRLKDALRLSLNLGEIVAAKIQRNIHYRSVLNPRDVVVNVARLFWFFQRQGYTERHAVRNDLAIPELSTQQSITILLARNAGIISKAMTDGKILSAIAKQRFYVILDLDRLRELCAHNRRRHTVSAEGESNLG